MKLLEFVNSLDKRKQYELGIELAEKALPIWEKYSKTNSLEYIDTIVGMDHCVDKNILSRTLQQLKNSLFKASFNIEELTPFHQEFSDPIVALQDDDWNLPYSVSRIFYSVFNLLKDISQTEVRFSEESLIYISINQSIDAITTERLMTEQEIFNLLKSYN